MTDRESERPTVDESSYGGSAAETGGLDDDAGPTTANSEGGLVDADGPGADPGAAYERAVAEGQVPPAEDEPSTGIGDVYRSGS